LRSMLMRAGLTVLPIVPSFCISVCALNARFSAGFIVFNLIVAVVCDAVAIVDRQARAADEEEKAALRDEQEQPLQEQQREDPACDRDIVRAAQTRVWNLTTHVVMMRTRQEELLKAMAELSEQVLDAQVEASRALGVPLLDDSAEYDDDDDDDDDSDEDRAEEDATGKGAGGGRASFDGGARTFQRQIDRVSARLDRLQDPSSLASLSHGNLLANDDLSLSADTPVSRRLSSSSS
jgi:hypothetical protein